MLPAEKPEHEFADNIGFRSRLLRWGIVLLVAVGILLIAAAVLLTIPCAAAARFALSFDTEKQEPSTLAAPLERKGPVFARVHFELRPGKREGR